MLAFDSIYQGLLSQIMTHGIREVNERTGHETATVPGLTFSIDLEKDGFPLLTLRKIPIKLFVAEQIWFLTGSRDPNEFLHGFTKIWDDFTNPAGIVTVAYGYRWRHHFGRDQIGDLVAHLKKNPSSRHGVVVAWDPASDGLGGVKRANVPCPYTFTVNIIGGRLCMNSIVRSNDMILGFPHDVAGFAVLQSMLAQELGVRQGIYSQSISNAHVYDTHYDAAEELIHRSNDHQKIELSLPEHSFERAEKADVALAEEIVKSLEDQYTPLPPIKGLKIIL